jgi:hypothetical protein
MKGTSKEMVKVKEGMKRKDEGDEERNGEGKGRDEEEG